ncbi:MAG: tetratricopeptide repeat protein [Verrucomicrobia bacterium]|nr:tetratricopeptide repeat protein [Verrucomicrobiota bacterium]
MKKQEPNRRRSQASASNANRAELRQAGQGKGIVLGLLGAGLIACAGFFFFWNRSQKSTVAERYVPRPKGTLTFTKDIAPIIFQRCAFCHRPGQSAPFALLSFAEVKKRAEQIADVTARRYMPPWLPEPGHGDFADERRLTEDELGRLQQWIAEGAVEGNPSDLLPLPKWTEGWHLGQPDLVVKMPLAYTLPAEGKDVYRNFVFSIPVSAARFVKGVEFLPGNAQVVHHAFIQVDETGQSRRLAARQNPPGFDGMELPDTAIMPGGQLLGWQPGKVPYFASDGLAWVLKPNTDLVLQLHMNPTGKPETVQPTLGFYFTDQAPTNVAFRIKLAHFEMDIPPGATDYAVEQSYTLPIDLSLVRVSAHAHYLGKKLQGYAVLPDGEKRWLISIPDWDFFWQGDYRYKEPVSLPKATKLVMHYTYDNSTNNVRNPNRPPKPVRFGLQTTDEMAELFFQAAPKNPEERAVLAKDYFEKFTEISMNYFRFRLRLDPNDAHARMRLGRALSSRGQASDAVPHLLAAIRLKPDDDKAHYELGYLLLLQKQLPAAEQEFRAVIRLNPDDYQAFGNLGYICLQKGRRQEAQSFFETALRLNPDDAVARRNLDLLKSKP